MKQYYVYIMASQRNGTLYIGVTSDLIKRVWQHKEKQMEGFTSKYNVNLLVFFQIFESPEEAIKQEKRLKKLLRKDKLALIEKEILLGMICIIAYYSVILGRSPGIQFAALDSHAARENDKC